MAGPYIINTVLLLLALTTDSRGQFFDFFQSYDPFLQTHQTIRPPVKPSFESTYYVPIHSNKRTSPNHRNEPKKNEENKNDNSARKASRTERTTHRNTESFTRNPLKSIHGSNATLHSFIDISSNNRNLQFFNKPKTDSNKRQNENNQRLKSNGNVNESSRYKTVRQKQTNREESRSNNSKQIAPQNKNAWETIEADITDHKKDKRVSSYENNSNNQNTFNILQISSTFPTYANEIKNPFDSSDQSENINYYGSENIPINAYSKPNQKENSPSHVNRKLINIETNHNSKNIPITSTYKQNQNSGTNSRPTQSSFVKVFEDGNDKRFVNNAWSTSYNERKPTNNEWVESLYADQENYNRPNSHNRRPDKTDWTTQSPFNTPSGRQPNDRRPTNRWTTQKPYISGIVRPVGNENKPPITNRPPKYNQRPQTPITRQPVYDGISFPDDEDETPDLVTGPDEDYMSEAERRRYIEIAERMCDKYKDLDTERVAAIPLIPSPEPVSVSVSKCVPTTIPLIVGGKVVSIKEFPHMALLGWKNVQGGGYSWKCGGTIVSDQYVLTAAHCSYQERDNSVVAGPPRVVQLGSSYLDDPGAIVIRVSAAIRHPKYKLPSSYYDLAVLRLTTKVSFSERIKPACLGAPPSPGHPIIATGWGRTEFGGDQSNELRSVSLPIWRMDECWKVLGTSRKLPNGPSPESQICAGEIAGGKDTCQGDSGGPAQVQDGCAWRVVAVTSVGRACGAARTPALYATVQRAFVAAVAFGGR